MASPGRMFNTPPGVRMSPGKKRVLYGPAPNLKSLHSALTRVSAALAETRNLFSRMMNAGVAKRNIHQRHQKLFNERARLYATRRKPSADYQQRFNQLQKEINSITLNVRNKEKQSNKLIKQWENSKKRYQQLARRVVYTNGSRNLNARPLTQREREVIRVSGAIVRNMSAARRTARHLPLPQNLGMMIIRSAARR